MSLKRSLAWMSFAQGSSFVLQLAGSVVLSRYLTAYEVGIYAVAAATAGVLAVVQSFGLQSLIVREEKLTPEIAATAFTVNAVISVGLAIAIAVFSYAGGAFLHDPRVESVLLALSITPLFGVFDFLPAANLERRGQFRAMSLIATVTGACAALATIVLVVLGFSYMSLAYAGWISAAANTVGLNIVGRRYVRFRVGFAEWRRVADFGLQMMAITGVQSVSFRLGDVILGRLLGLSALGLYNRASNLNGLIWTNVHLVIGRVLFVDFADLNRRKVSLRDRYIRTVDMLTALLWPAFAGFALLSGPLILAVYGAKWVPAAQPMALLAIASIFSVAITMTWELFAATGQLRTQTRIEFIRAGLSLAVFAAACTASLNAAAAARIFDAVLALFIYRPYLNRMTQTSLGDFLRIYARNAALTALAIGPAALLMVSFRMSPSAPLPLALGSIPLGAAFWGVGLLAMNHPLASEARAWRDRFRRKAKSLG